MIFSAGWERIVLGAEHKSTPTPYESKLHLKTRRFRNDKKDYHFSLKLNILFTHGVFSKVQIYEYYSIIS